MSVIVGISILLGFFALGEFVSVLVSHFIPGSVLGMLFLFFSLLMGWVSPERIRPVATFLTKNMTVFFLPAFMGILDQWDIISVNFVGWILVVLLSTIAVFFSSGFTAKKVEQFNKNKRKEEQK